MTRVAMASNVFPSKDELFRHAEIQYKNLLSTEPQKVYNDKSDYNTTERLVLQRLIVSTPADDQFE